MAYNDSFRTKIVQKTLMPGAKPVSVIARDAGMPEQTLYRWRREFTLRQMGDRPHEPKPAATTRHDWTPEEKLALVLEAAAVPEAELGEFLRRKGLHEAQLVEWQAQALAGLRGTQARKAASEQSRRVAKLERELRRKEKALAEAAALLVLKKKVQAIWGDEDDDTDPECDE